MAKSNSETESKAKPKVKKSSGEPKAPATKTRKKPARAPEDARETVRGLARQAAQYALEKKAENVRLLDLTGITSITDFFVIASADTDRQVKAIAENVIAEMRDKVGHAPWRSEGWDGMRWIIVDFVDFVVHVFQTEARQFYNLERLWADAPSEAIQDAAKPKRTTRKKAADAEAEEPKRAAKIRIIESE